ncbi:hypothetical protein A8E25_34860 [Burkholderia cenocepacia]|nr:hypothetical protein BURCENK562V_C4579 [Burkholderia cenocepacia K56-2Valvano]ERI31289.1 hypothetical protein BURCENBC7_AP2621 [Burkholderia cenocepacia BC7]ONR61705.1 hypothetical protein A8E17_11400 [Burkholderia cenocepacia]ONR68440.1 hypothetical protein A8E18_21645 [Burkholderia cenocepacia]ONR73770.1 hypothetical protein A8E23_10820 [Burkholderia cenocepacia]
MRCRPGADACFMPALALDAKRPGRPARGRDATRVVARRKVRPSRVEAARPGANQRRSSAI